MTRITGVLSTDAGAGGPALALESTSLRFPAANTKMVAGQIGHMTADPGPGPLFATDGALVAAVAVPWFGIGYLGEERTVLLGNDAGTVPDSGDISVQLVRLAESAGFEVRFAAANATESAALTFPLSQPQHSLVIAVRQTGGSLSLDLFADGVKLGGGPVPAAFSGLTPAGGGVLVGCGGLSGSLTPDSSVGGFDGEIAFLGYYEGTLSDTALLDLSEGQPVSGIASPAAWRLAGAWDEMLQAFATPAWATGAAANAWALAGGGAARPGGDVLPAQDAGARLTLDAVTDGQVWGTLPGAGTAPVTLSGTATGATGPIELRTRLADGSVHQDWAEIPGSTIAGGVWSGTLDRDLFPNWGHVEIRARDMPSLLVRSRMRCAVGRYVVMVGQSNIAFPWEGHPNITPVVGTGTGDLAVAIQRNGPSGAQTIGNVFVRPVDDQDELHVGWVAAAQEWARMGDAPLLVVDAATNGADYRALIDDANSNVSWARLDEIAAVVGGTATAFLVDWFPSVKTSDAFEALIDGTGSLAADHALRDGAPWSPGAKVIYSNSVGFHGSDGPHDQDRPQMEPGWLKITKGWTLAQTKAWLNRIEGDPNSFLGPYMADVALEPNSGHPEPDYQGRCCARYMLAIGQALGLTGADANPEITAVHAAAPFDTIAVEVSLPNGGRLTTDWATDSQAPQSGTNAVQGFEIWEPQNALASRSGFTASIVDDGAATGTGIVHLVRGTGSFPKGTEVFYAPGAGLTYGVATTNGQLWKGLLKEATGHDSGYGVPLPQDHSETTMTNFVVPAGLEWDISDRFAASGEQGDWWDIHDLASLTAVGGGTPVDGQQVERVSGQRGLIDLIRGGEGGVPGPHSYPVYRSGGGRPYLEMNLTASLTTDQVIDYTELFMQIACSNLVKEAVWDGPPLFIRRGGTADQGVCAFVTGPTAGPGFWLSSFFDRVTYSPPNWYDGRPTNWPSFWLEPHVPTVRAGSSITDISRHGASVDMVHFAYVSGSAPADAVSPDTYGRMNLFNNWYSGHFYGGILGDDPVLHRRNEQQFWRRRMGPHTPLQID